MRKSGLLSEQWRTITEQFLQIPDFLSKKICMANKELCLYSLPGLQSVMWV